MVKSPTEAESFGVRVDDALHRRSAFYRAFGEFVLGFANTEREVFEALFIISDVTGWVAKSIFSGVHLDTAKDFINRIIAAKAARGSTEDYWLLTDAFQQLGHITESVMIYCTTD